MTILSLARFQFAMTTVYHFFFVPFSIGTAFIVAIMESMYVSTKDETYKKMAKFWGNIFLLSFAVGVVTGLIQEFQFGMNSKLCYHSLLNQHLLAYGYSPGKRLNQGCTFSLFG